MEDLEKHYFLLLPQEEQELIQHFYESLRLEKSSTQRCQQQICDLLLNKPYPALDILLLKWTKYKYHIKTILLKVFEELLNRVPANGFDNKTLKFLNKIPEEILQNSLEGPLRKCLHDIKLNREFYLCLMGRETTQSLYDILELLKETQWQYFQNPLGTKEYTLYQALDNKAHFLTLMANQITNFKAISDVQLRNNLIILKLVQEFSMTNQLLSQLPNIQQCLEHFDIETTTEDLRSVYKYFYKDFKRLTVIINYAQKFKHMSSCISVQDILLKSSNLEVINKYKLLNNYEETKAFIDSYYMWQNSLTNSIKDYELETVCHYFILDCVFQIIVTPSSQACDEFYVQKLQSLNALLRQMKNFQLLCQILEDILKFTYLRWEHLEKHNDSGTGKLSSKLMLSSDTSYTDDDILPDSTSKTKIKTKLYQRTGFICKSKAFAQLYNFLKTFVTKKLHSADFKNACSDNQQRFQDIVDYIADILWKYSLLEKLESSQNQAKFNNVEVYLDPEYLPHFVRYHVDALDRLSSDDEEKQTNYHSHYNSLSRRKAAKKRRRATFSGAIARPKEDLSLQQCRVRANALANSVANIDPLKHLDNSKNKRDINEERSIVLKLLESPQRLAVLALSLKSFNDAKQIIENFNLQNSQLNTELQYVEQQQNIKHKLSTIYENYQRQEKQTHNSKEPLATVEQIRNVAAKGFEVSKIISVIDNFAQSQRIKQSEAIKELIQKHKQNPQYRFLSQFEESNLNAVIICDLILNLPLNRDIITSILMVIKRHQSIQSSFKEVESMEKSQLPKNIGPLNLLENLNDCMRLLEGKSVRDLLADNSYSLRPQKLSVELAREKIFEEIFYKKPSELSRCDDLKSMLTQFQNLESKCNYYQRFCNYVYHLTKLVHLRDPNCEFHVEELLKIDPCDVVGELIFNCDMTPLEIEGIVTALNLNLVHVIALNICPEIVGKCGLKKRQLTAQKQATIFNYIANYNRLLVYLLQGINNKDYFTKDDNNIDSIYLERILCMSEIDRLSSLYGGNKIIATLRCDNVNMKLLEKVESKREQLELLQLDIGIQEPKLIKSKRVDSLIIDLIHEDAKNINLSPKIHDIGVRANLIHKNFTKIATTRLAKELIETTLQHREAVQKIPKSLRHQLEATLVDITIYAKVSEVMQFETWPQAYDFGLKTPSTIFERLLQLHLYKLCYEWCNVVKLADNFKPQRKNLLNILLGTLTDMSDDQQSQEMHLNTYEYLLHILETFPEVDCIAFLDNNKDKFRSMFLLKYAINFLERLAKSNDKELYKNYKISIIIFEQLTPGIRKQFWNLLKFPLLIIEQLIMNAKFEILTKVLQSVRQELDREANIELTDSHQLCPFCFDKNGNIYDLHAKNNSPLKTRFQLGSVESTNASAFILLNFNLYQKDHFITNDCIDLLLRIYATKALDYQISDTSSASEPCSQSTCDMQQSLDSLCGAFQMPHQAPTRAEWTKDEEATHCMCCRRAAFTMLMRRHHCRRCGRVVCFACSTHRMRIPELYEDVEVRICNDCHRLSEDFMQRKSNRDSLTVQVEDVDNIPVKSRTKPGERFKWKLSGNITHDKLLREEFCYEHAPSVALCLSILDYHLGKQKCVDLLLFHCRKLEKLIVPNPEVDYELVAKMMNCLALAAKVRGAPAEVETIREHSEIIISVVQNGCESLIPPDPLNNHGLRKLADSLVQAERWELALEVHLKCGYPTAGVMAAHGLSCLRVGCYDTAREKFYHCMPKLTNETTNTAICKVIFNTKLQLSTNGNFDNILGLTKDHEITLIRRPQHGPPLLQEILKLIESSPLNKTQPETLQRASIIRSSNTSLVSLLSRRKETYVKRMHEPAINILNTLASLKRVSTNSSDTPVKRKTLFRKTRGFEECIYYVLTYGSHADVIKFLMQHNDLMATLKYFILQKLEPELFIQHILLEHLKRGQMPQLISQLQEFDSRLLMWRTVLLQACRYLETHNHFNSLYQLQLLLNDPIRASMTCVKFYSMNCENFQQQHTNAQHLHNAHLHLQTELEVSKWDNINFNTSKTSQKNGNSSRRSSSASITSSTCGGNLQMQMDARSLNAHINTILKQLDVAKFLAKCEVENSSDDSLITEKYLKQIRLDSNKTLPTLFDKVQEKIQICILILLCGKNIDEGFGLAYRIIQDYKLPPIKIFAATAKILARNQRLTDVDKLLNCITSNNGVSTRDIDEILSVAINSATNNHEPEVKTALDNLAKKINSVELRISSHIFIGQLKSAYLLANKYKRDSDIRKILRQAEATNQIHIKKLCEKKLQMSMSGTSQTN
ncbi:zinc finger FYVE domain-containing protein 26 homolog [Lucilia cuprina]|uniref:zinc finger FYVE domain-containing protein 26 homolog n=1 Tax=Lucilia cuprina TaxID=7375 RepID=UPI001F06D2C5|nr:zinc finger FYVE domain-containing protein 26 homolog [Lucilia cuprina]